MSWIRWETFGADYLLLVVMVCVGVFQFVAAWRRLDGLSFFFGRAYLAYLFAIAIIGVAHWLFFREERIVPDYAGGLGGSQLFIYTMGGIAIAGILTLVLSSALNARWRRLGTASADGLDALKSMSYFQAIRKSLRGKR